MTIRVVYMLATMTVFFCYEAGGIPGYNPLKMGIFDAHQSAVFQTMATIEHNGMPLTDPAGCIQQFMIENGIDPENP